MPSDLAALYKGELITLIYHQAREIEILKETIIELQEKINQKGSGDNSAKTVPAFVKANIKKKRKSGKRKLREHGFSRKLDIPTQSVFHSFDTGKVPFKLDT